MMYGLDANPILREFINENRGRMGKAPGTRKRHVPLHPRWQGE